MGRFTGKIALITGSTQGVGEAVARRLAAESAAGIVVCGRNTDRGHAVAAALEEAGTEAIFVPVELGDEANGGAPFTVSLARLPAAGRPLTLRRTDPGPWKPTPG